jgi:hypothetical protein
MHLRELARGGERGEQIESIWLRIRIGGVLF